MKIHLPINNFSIEVVSSLSLVRAFKYKEEIQRIKVLTSLFFSSQLFFIVITLPLYQVIRLA
jgi:hypothetical protein